MLTTKKIYFVVSMIGVFRGPILYMPIAITSMVEVSIISDYFTYLSASTFNFRNSVGKLNRCQLSSRSALMFYFQLSVSLKRIEKFLNREEIDKQAIQHDPNAKKAISIKDATFTWNRSKSPTLKRYI